MKTFEGRFWEKVDRQGPHACWEWLAYRNAGGYGQLTVHGRSCHAHRVAWELTHGPILRGAHNHDICVLHTCDNPGCVNPAHLFLGSQAVNVEDMNAKGRNGHAAKTHCPRGHEYTPENTRVENGSRLCRECIRLRVRKAYYGDLERRRAYARQYVQRRRERLSLLSTTPA